jgi:trigger factor
MITKNINKLPKSVVEVTVSMPWSDLEPLWNQTLTRMSQEVELPGFRKGTAPLPMVEQNLGARLQDEVLRSVMPQALVDALQGTDVVPIDYPQYSEVSFAKGNNLQFKAHVTQRPQVTVGDYKTIKVGRPQIQTTTDEQINKIIDDLFARWKARQPANVSSNQPQPQGGSLNFSGQTMPQAPLQDVPAAPNDQFAQAVGAKNLLDLHQKIKQDLEAEAQYNNELDYEEAILQEVEKVTQVEIPEILVEDELKRMLVSLQRRVADMGLLMEDYLRTQNKTLEGLKGEWREQAEKNVRMELGLSEIARMENVNISDQEVQAEIDKIQDARVKQQFEAEEPRLHLKHSLRQVRTLNLLKGIVTAS